MQVVPQPKTVSIMNTRSDRRAERLKKEEEELEKFMAQGSEEEQETEVEEETSAEEQPEETTEEVETQEDNLDDEEKTFKKRYGDLRRYQAEEKKKLNAEIKELKDQLAEQGKSVAAIEYPASDEDLDAWKEKYPDVAAIVETMARKIANEKFEKAKIDIDGLNNSRKEAAKDKAMSDIRKAHSDFDALQESDEFHDWVDEQPKWVQDALFENAEDAKAVIRVLDLYKADMGLTKADDKKKEKSAAKGVKTKTRTEPDKEDGSGYLRESEVKKWTAAQFEAREDEMMKAIAAGKFIYDVTGSAR